MKGWLRPLRTDLPSTTGGASHIFNFAASARVQHDQLESWRTQAPPGVADGWRLRYILGGEKGMWGQFGPRVHAWLRDTPAEQAHPNKLPCHFCDKCFYD